MRYVHPGTGLIGQLANRLANSSRLATVRRASVNRLPFPVLASDVVDVVYATWLVDAGLARRHAPPEATLWEAGGLTPFTILTYRHGHFGPKAAGPLRRLFPSPLQSNWRLYLASPLPGAPDCATVAFVSNVLDNTLYALGTRIFSDALPSHRARGFSLGVNAEGAAVSIDPGAGSALRFHARFRRAVARDLPQGFSSFAESWEAAAARLASQDAAVVAVQNLKRTALATISLPVALPSVEPLQLIGGTLDCPLLAGLAAQPDPLCFLLPRVYFQALSERLL